MILKITKKVGDANITADVDTGSDMPKALVGADWLLNAPTKCSVCNGTNLHFSARKSTGKEGKNAGKDFYYAQLRCLKDFAVATLGKFNDGYGYFWRDGGAFVPYQGKPSASADVVAEEETDVPF